MIYIVLNVNVTTFFNNFDFFDPNENKKKAKSVSQLQCELGQCLQLLS